jgi:hypothetical protein
MSLPATVRVKLSSENAEYVSLTPVVVQELPVRDLVEHMLGITGKDEARIHELLLRGTLVSGATRFRWTGWEADADAIRSLLATFPDPDPARPFDSARCVRAILRTTRQPIEIPKEAGMRKPLFRRTSFWAVLMEVAAASSPRYEDYSYRDHLDVYHATLAIESGVRLRQAVGLLKYTKLKEQVAGAALEAVDLYVIR